MKRKIFVTCALLLCVAVCFAIANSINGTWNGSVNVQGTDYPLIYTFKADSGKVTGTADNSQGSSPITNGKITGDTFTFNVDVNGTDVPHKGKFYPDADSIGMDIDYGGMKLHTTLKRAK
jgi:hypothetical protein